MIYKAPVSIIQDKVPHIALSGKLIDGSGYYPQIGTIYFKFSPLQLILGKLGFDVVINEGDNQLIGNIALDVFGDVHISDAHGRFTTQYLKAIIPDMANNLDMMSADIALSDLEAVIDNTNTFIPHTLHADIVVHNVILLGEKIGSYNIDATIEDTTKFATINSQEDSIFDIKSQLTLVDNQVKITGSISGKTDNAKELLENFGIKNNTLNRTINLN
jgi:hypothetical protein